MWVALAALGAVGAVARVVLTEVVGRAARRPVIGTFAVNVLGAFLLGLLVGADVGPRREEVIALGLLGSFTTFSTWMVETGDLGRVSRSAAILNVVGPFAAGLAAVALGRALA